MNIARVIAAAILLNSTVLSPLAPSDVEAQQPPPRPVPTVVWAPKPVKTPDVQAGTEAVDQAR